MNAVALLEKYFNDSRALRIIMDHSRQVAEKALRIADTLGRADLDRYFIEEAALLHDIGVCRTASPGIGCHGEAPYILHGLIGREILEAEGMPRHALVCERHIGVGLTAEDVRRQGLPLPEREMAPVTLEERIICFADLFYSKKHDGGDHERTPDAVRKKLARYGSEKISIFDDWLREFTYEA